MPRVICLRPWLLCVLACLVGSARAADGGSPLTADDLVVLKRISDPQVAPNGRLVAFVQGVGFVIAALAPIAGAFERVEIGAQPGGVSLSHFGRLPGDVSRERDHRATRRRRVARGW